MLAIIGRITGVLLARVPCMHTMCATFDFVGSQSVLNTHGLAKLAILKSLRCLIRALLNAYLCKSIRGPQCVNLPTEALMLKKSFR